MAYTQNTELIVDYKPITNSFERKAVETIFRILMNGSPLRLDFDTTKSVTLGKEKASFGIAPPKLFHLLLMLINPRYLICEHYIQGYWHCTSGEISDLVLTWQNKFDRWPSITKFFFEIQTRVVFLYKQYARPIKSTREVKNHYNVSAKFFQHIIGKSMAYSCAFFEEGDDLENAQKRKLDLTIERLSIEGDTLNILDIGCGWGSFGLHAIKNTHANVDGISIAENQIAYANLEKEKLPGSMSSRLSFYHADYKEFCRGETSVYDRIVSIGMIEHVGLKGYSDFFNCIYRLLKPGGIAVIQSITCTKTGATNMWADKYIFPGGCIPKTSDIKLGAECAGLSCNAVHHQGGINYVKTLKKWRDNLLLNYDACMNELSIMVMQEFVQKYNDSNEIELEKEIRNRMRTWYFYFSGLQSMFLRNKNQCDVCQFVFLKE